MLNQETSLRGRNFRQTDIKRPCVSDKLFKAVICTGSQSTQIEMTFGLSKFRRQ